MIEDVELLLTTHGIKYQKKGHIIKCLCPNPNHDDKNIGSFSFDTYKGVGHCFACGCSVNIFSFNKLLGEKGKFDKNYNYNFQKSLKPKKDEIIYYKPIVYGKLYSARYNQKVMDFLYSIGFSDEFINEKGIMYTNYSKMIAENLANDVDEKPTTMENRIVIPIYKDKKLVNYECRTFVKDEIKVKYVKGCSSNTIYNIENIDLTKDVVLVESIKNLGKGWNVTKNIISTFGNQLTDIKLEMLNKIPSIILFADYDEGGLIMLNKLKENYEGNLKVTFCPKTYIDSNGDTIGYDMNDCSIEEIEYYLNHTISPEKAEQRLSSNKEDEIFWK